MLRGFGLKHQGGNARTLKRRLDAEGVDYSHTRQGRDSNQGRRFAISRVPLKEVLVEGATYSRFHLKRRLLAEGVLANMCGVCGLGPQWNGSTLVLVLDHVNGVNNDNRLENLRLLCPNCNSQTSTFAGRNSKMRTWPDTKEQSGRLCQKCDAPIVHSARTGFCDACSRRSRRKVERPSRDELLRLVQELGYTGAGRRYGVSDNAVRQWLKADEK